MALGRRLFEFENANSLSFSEELKTRWDEFAKAQVTVGDFGDTRGHFDVADRACGVRGR
jgi:hypothetical protein